jgi:hypothetical protein
MNKRQIVNHLMVFIFSMMASISNADSNDSSHAQLPVLSGDNLNGKTFHLPQDLPAERTLVLIAFEREQQATLDTWSKGLDLINTEIPWIELPVISTPYVLGSFFIGQGMRRGIPNPKVRDRVITVYTDREAFATSMGFDYDKEGAYVAVIERSGKNLGVVKGPYDENKAKVILDLMSMK